MLFFPVEKFREWVKTLGKNWKTQAEKNVHEKNITHQNRVSELGQNFSREKYDKYGIYLRLF